MLLNFDDVSAGLSESEVHFRLIGMELLMIDEQGFISSNWVVRYQGNLNCGTIYRLMNFFATKANTSIYRVVDHNLTIRFTHSSVLSELQDNQLYKVINPQSLNEHAVLDGVDGGWQHSKVQESLAAPAALLVTTVNTKHIGELYSNETNHKCDKWCLSFCSTTYKSRSSTPGAVNVCNTAIGGTCSTWSLAEPSASSKESVVQEKAKYETFLNQPQSRNPNHGCLIGSLTISKLLPSLSFFSYLPPFVWL
ncbi:hypothetical protein Bca4012_071654 [Brassica carinata]|uniref:Uncharacterized protein n=1 Tax=Brassica carinata TaxID=52824 RepID=A0A8X7QHC2_BRACI|nr:hypothetical protein Bca52824_063907 [Brassica carinata]